MGNEDGRIIYEYIDKLIVLEQYGYDFNEEIVSAVTKLHNDIVCYESKDFYEFLDIHKMLNDAIQKFEA